MEGIEVSERGRLHHLTVAMACSMLWYDREESGLIGEMQGNVVCECYFGLQVKVVRGHTTDQVACCCCHRPSFKIVGSG